MAYCVNLVQVVKAWLTYTCLMLQDGQSVVQDQIWFRQSRGERDFREAMLKVRPMATKPVGLGFPRVRPEVVGCHPGI